MIKWTVYTLGATKNGITYLIYKAKAGNYVVAYEDKLGTSSSTFKHLAAAKRYVKYRLDKLP